jgi:uncharacterized damage-inducible protein DinB
MEQEAWLSGAVEKVSPILMPAVHALMQAGRDVEKAVENLTVAELWTKPNDAPSVGFHLLHIAGSIDRLLAYSRGEKLNEAQFAELRAENLIDDSLNGADIMSKTFERIEIAIREISLTPVEILFEKRAVGRKQLPTNVFGLLFHIAEHTQRHVGQIVATAKIIRQTNQNF